MTSIASLTTKGRLVKNILTILVAGVGAFYISYQHQPENHGYAKQDIEAVNDYLAMEATTAPKYKWSTMADIDALFPSELPIRSARERK